MVTVPRWEIYYVEGAYTPAVGGWQDWLDAPARGVIAVTAQSDLLGRHIMAGTDYYLWWPGAEHPWSVDKAGLWDWLHEVGSPLATQSLDNPAFERMAGMGVKFGRSMDLEAYRRRMAEVAADPAFPEQSALPPAVR